MTMLDAMLIVLAAGLAGMMAAGAHWAIIVPGLAVAVAVTVLCDGDVL